MLANIIILAKSKLAHNLKNELKIWAINSAGEDLHSKLKIKIKMITAFTVTNTLIASIGVFLFVKPLSNDINIFFVFRLINDYFPNYKHFLEILYRSTFIVLGYLLLVHCYQVIYFTQHINFQLELFKATLTGLAEWKNISSREDDLFYNEQYQTEIKRRLKFCIIRWEEFLK